MRFKHFILLVLLLFSTTPSAFATATGRSQWVWSDVFNMMSNPVRRDHVLNLWESQGIDTGFLWIDATTIATNPGSYRSLIADMHARGMKAISLDGDPSFVLPGASHAQAIARFQSVLDFNAASLPNEQFDGAHFDNEPWSLPQWGTDPAGTLQQYLTLSSEYIQLRDAAGSSMPVSADTAFILAATQFSYINNTLWDGVTKPAHQHVQDIYDSVTLLDYRDFALGADGIVPKAQPWLDYGDLVGKPVEIGVETLGPQVPELVTFFDEGIAFMETELALAEAQFLPRPSFDGFAIHHLGSYEPLLLAEATPGDINLDGVVDSLDLSQWQLHHGQTGQFWTQGDADQDGDVDGSDFLIWQRAASAGGAPVSGLETVPEPSSLALLLIAASGWGVVCRRSRVRVVHH